MLDNRPETTQLCLKLSLYDLLTQIIIRNALVMAVYISTHLLWIPTMDFYTNFEYFPTNQQTRSFGMRDLVHSTPIIYISNVR